MKTASTSNRLRPLVAALLSASVCVALAADPKSAQYYEDALARFEKKDYPGSIVQLKNVLRTDAKNLSAQVLLGKALLENGDVGPAEVAFSEALRLGVNRAEVVVPLAKCLILQGKPEEVLNAQRFAADGLPKGTLYQLLLQKAAAATDMADPKVALKVLEEARVLEPKDAASWIAEVPARIRARQPKEALAAADKAIALAPEQADAHYARGEALHVVPNLAGAMASYDKALALNPQHLGARLTRAGVHMDFNRIDAAAADVAEAVKIAPREPRALYLRALIAQRRGATEESRKALQELTAMLDPIPLQYTRFRPQTQMLGGMAHYGLGQREKAKPYLEGVLRSSPGHPVSKVLASIYLSEGNTDPAITTLDTYIRAHPADAQAMVMLASAHMSQGRHARATQILQEALKLGEQPGLRTSLGLSLVGGGRYGDAIKELEQAYAKDPRQLQAGYALGSLYVQSGMAAPALRVAESLDKAHPKNAGVLNLLGAAKRLKGDSAGARAAFEAATAVDPAFASALVSLARLDMDARDFPKATTRLNAVLAKNDKDLDVISAVADLSERMGKLEDTRRWLEKADGLAGADNASYAVALVDFHLRHNQVAPAKEAIKRAQGKAPEALQTLIAAARVQMASGDLSTARSNLSRAANTANYNAPLLTKIALLQLQAGAPPAAAYSLDKALTERADYVPALALRTEIEIRQGEYAKAEQRARQVLALTPKQGLGHALLGDLAMARGQRDAGLASFRKAHEIDRNSGSLMRLFAATVGKDRAGAIKLAEQWLAQKPTDRAVLRAVADLHFVAGNLPRARAHYEALLKVLPDEPETLNNLANVMLAQKDPSALAVAEKALALSPGAPHIVGTVGWASFKAGQKDRALQLLRDARLRDPENADTRYFLGSVLASTGRAAEAREELDAALKSTAVFASRNEAEALRSTLK
jgi:cellulose synthase operon protein C